MAQELYVRGFIGFSGSSSYHTKHVVAEDVEGVEIRFSAKVVRSDCNRTNERISYALVSGDGRGDHDKYVVEHFQATMKTEMNCPYEKPVTDTIYSELLTIKAVSDQSGNKKVRVTFVMPGSCKIEVAEIR
jgi:serine protease inhibitor ecotin